jgi:DNA-binding MarR family transcriptional regulator
VIAEVPPVPERVGYLLKRAQHALRAAMDEAVQPLGLTTAQYAALAGLGDGPLSGAALARRCFVTPQAMNEVLVGLERRGLVERRPHASHGRVVEARLSPSGRAALAPAHRAVRAVEERMVEGLDEPERRRLASALRRCVTGLEAAGRAPSPGRRPSSRSALS